MKIFPLVFTIVFFSFSCVNKQKDNEVDQVEEIVAKSIFNEEESQLLTKGEKSDPFRVLTIENVKDSLLLRSKSKGFVVEPNDSLLILFSERLIATVQDSATLGVGIAAPQVGFLKNIICIQRFDKVNKPFEVYYNPKISQYSKKIQPCREGCLSIPGRMDTLSVRSYAILLEYENIAGEHQFEMVEDFTAVIFQHEIDHLNGILYTDYLHQKAHEQTIGHVH